MTFEIPPPVPDPPPPDYTPDAEQLLAVGWPLEHRDEETHWQWHPSTRTWVIHPGKLVPFPRPKALDVTAALLAAATAPLLDGPGKTVDPLSEMNPYPHLKLPPVLTEAPLLMPFTDDDVAAATAKAAKSFTGYLVEPPIEQPGPGGFLVFDDPQYASDKLELDPGVMRNFYLDVAYNRLARSLRKLCGPVPPVMPSPLTKWPRLALWAYRAAMALWRVRRWWWQKRHPGNTNSVATVPVDAAGGSPCDSGACQPCGTGPCNSHIPPAKRVEMDAFFKAAEERCEYAELQDAKRKAGQPYEYPPGTHHPGTGKDEPHVPNDK